MTRIVGGLARGRQLAVPPKGTRPTSDRSREALFAALIAGLDLDGARVLDLYAGTGAVGSRGGLPGAARAALVETRHPRRRGAAGHTGAPGLAEPPVAGAGCEGVLGRQRGRALELVFADPPYGVSTRT